MRQKQVLVCVGTVLVLFILYSLLYVDHFFTKVPKFACIPWVMAGCESGDRLECGAVWNNVTRLESRRWWWYAGRWKTCGVIPSPKERWHAKAGNYSGAFKVLNFHFASCSFHNFCLVFHTGTPKVLFAPTYIKRWASGYLESWIYLQTFVISLMWALSVPICNFKI